MSAPPKFATLPDAIAAYLAGRSKRWAEVDGWQIDLEQAANPCAVSRPEVEDDSAFVRGVPLEMCDRGLYDRAVARNVAFALSQAVEVLPELAVPADPPPDASDYRCPWCSRPWDGAK